MTFTRALTVSAVAIIIFAFILPWFVVEYGAYANYVMDRGVVSCR